MASEYQRPRQIALFVEGDTERGEARRRTLPTFIHKWLDPQLPEGKKVGIRPVKFQGVSNYLDDLPQKVAWYLARGVANFVVGLVDLYSIPPSHVDLSRWPSLREKIVAARSYIRSLVATQYQDRFRQHFAVHEVEAWLLAYPQEWPASVRAQIEKRPPEQVNFNEPPAKFLKRILGSYKKTTTAMNLFPKVDPQTAIDRSMSVLEALHGGCAAPREAVAVRVAAVCDPAGNELDTLRTRWLNPPEWTKQEVLEFPGSTTGPWARYVHDADARGIGGVRYPRLVPKDEDCAKKLQKRTLTNLYNERPTWLDLAHKKLDAAAAYGWPAQLADEEILGRLLKLNLERAAGI